MLRLIARPALLLLGAALILLLGENRSQAVGDLRPLTFAEDSAAEGLRRRLSRQPQGRLHWIVAEPLLAIAPMIRGAGTVYALRAGAAPELVEIAPTGVVSRRFVLGHRPSSFPVMDRRGEILISATDGHVVAVDPVAGGVRAERMGYGYPATPAVGLANQIYLTHRHGMVIAFLGRSGFERRTTVTLALGTAERGRVPLPSAPTVGADGSVYLCGGAGKRLLRLSAEGKSIWSRPTLDCDNAPLVTPDGRVVVSGEGGLQIFDLTGGLRATVSLAGRGGRPVLGTDGAILVATTTGSLASVTTAGVIRWTFPVGAHDPPPEPATSPEGIHVVAPEGHVITLGLDGAVRWSIAVPRPAPGLAVRPDGGVYVVSTGHSLRLVSGPAPRKNANRVN
jgi:outer membrane protein assembly factor BamB